MTQYAKISYSFPVSFFFNVILFSDLTFFFPVVKWTFGNGIPLKAVPLEEWQIELSAELKLANPFKISLTD